MLTLLSVLSRLEYSFPSRKMGFLILQLRNLGLALVLSIIILVIFIPAAQAQQQPTGVFFLPRLPEVVMQKQPLLLKQINSEIIKAKKTAQVYLVLDKYLNAYPRTSVTVLRFTTRDHLERYSYWSGPNAYGSSDFSKVTAARAINTDKIYQRYQFEEFFRDTLVVLDSVKLTILSQDIKVGPEAVFHAVSSAPIHQQMNKYREFVLTLANPTQAGVYLPVEYQLTGSIRLKCTFYFLSEMDKAEILGVINNLRETPSGAQPLAKDEVDLSLKQYIRERFGQAKGWNLNKITGL